MNPIELSITESQLERAKSLYDFDNLSNSITSGKSQIYGAMGEILLMDYLISNGINVDYIGSRHFDLIAEDVIKIDVKTIRVNTNPKPEHNANISAFNTTQQTFMYFWVYVKEDLKTAWLVGWLDKETFYEEAKLNKKGDEDGGGWVFKSDTYSLKIKNLIDTDSLISNLKQINMSATKKQYEEVREELNLEFQPQQIMSENNLWMALARFQQEVPVIHKATQGYGYTYADLTKIIQVINPILAKHGLGYTQPLMGSSIKTIVFHIESGETLESVIDIPQGVSLKGMNDFQVLGSAISYLRRYSLASILTLITDADLDASGVQQAKKQEEPQPQAQKPVISEKDFLKLCGAINAKKMHNNVLIDKDWAEKMYSLTPEQLKTISMIN
jgi:hypothetical protein